MKDFDIEKLERQNVFTAKEDFFAQMQNNVLQHAPARVEGKVIKLNWAYAAAAAIALIFGFTFFVNSDPGEDKVIVAQNAVPKVNKKIEIAAVENQTQEVVSKEFNDEYLTPVQNVHQTARVSKKNTVTEKSVKFASQKENVNAKSADLQVDQILSNFTSAELADLSQKSEQDIYLDLYN